MTDEQRTALAQHLDALALPFAANAVRQGYDRADVRDGSCGCKIAVLVPCPKHRPKVAA